MSSMLWNDFEIELHADGAPNWRQVKEEGVAVNAEKKDEIPHLDVACIEFKQNQVHPSFREKDFFTGPGLLPGYQVHVVGYPMGFSVIEKDDEMDKFLGTPLLPFWKAGFIGSGQPFRSKAILIDALTTQGMSGSPVLISFPRHGKLQLLGIYSCRWNPRPEAFGDANIGMLFLVEDFKCLFE